MTTNDGEQQEERREIGPKPKLLSGGNPQIPKGVADRARRPRRHKAAKWNQPFYGHERSWFLSFRCYTKYVQLQFFRGTFARSSAA